MEVTFDMIRSSSEIRTYITQADASLTALGFTEHSFALAVDENGSKLSKQTRAPAIGTDNPLELLHAAAVHLGLGALGAKTPQAFWSAAVGVWAEKYGF